jgi:signal transduction histidine kinase
MTGALARIAAMGATVVVVLLVCAHVALGVAAAEDQAAAAHRREVDALTAALALVTSADDAQSVLARVGAGRDGRAAVHLPGGQVVGTARADTAALRGASTRRVVIEYDGSPLLLAPVTTRMGPAVVEVLRGDQDTGAWVADVALLAAAGIVAAVVAVALTGRARRALARQVATLADTAKSLGPGRFSPPPIDQRVGELVALRETLGGIARRWSVLRVDEQNLLADLSHRLRTPLTVLRLESGAITEEDLARRIREALDVLEHALDGVITGVPVEPMTVRDPTAPADVVEVITGRMAYWLPLLEAQDRHTELDLPETSPLVPMAADDLADTLDALLVNVISYTAPGAPVAVRVVVHARWVTVVVEDGGPGILDPTRALARGLSTGGSTGLGLDIAKSCARSAGGSLHIERSTWDGVRVRVRIPELGSPPAARSEWSTRKEN